jgi:AAA+ ATPase superfamily predicted ATPase
MTGLKKVPRHVQYDLDDPLLRFWFRFVFPQTSYIMQMGTQQAVRDRIRPELDSYFGACFERLCREALPSLYAREETSASFQIGEYWDKSVQIDLVGIRDDGWIDIGECKWGTIRSHRKIQDELECKVQKYPNRQNATICRRIFTRQKVCIKDAGPTQVKFHCLEDLYE